MLTRRGFKIPKISWPIGPIRYFVVLFCLVHLWLPRMNRENVGPITAWQLFSSTRVQPFYDLILAKGGAETLFTVASRQDIHRFETYKLWGISGHLVGDEHAHENLELVKSLLDEEGYRLVGVCRIPIPLAKYFLLSPEEKRTSCEVVPLEI